MASVRPLLAARSALALAALTLLAACGARPIVAEPIPLCERCHGGNGSAAPPRTVRGLTDTSVRGVGAHRRHLQAGPGDVHAPYPCETCHVVPTSVDAHLDAVVRVRFQGAPTAGGGATWNPATGRCENAYCHGATLKDGTRGSVSAPAWTTVDGTQMECGSCHKAPPDSHALYAEPTNCHRCHPRTVKADGTIDLASGQHIDGATPVSAACDGCHDAPPRTGAHLAHANVADPASVAYGDLSIGVGTAPSGGAAYVFGCGYCHPLDPSKHRDGHVDVDVAPGGAGLKALNMADAAFDDTSSRCSGVYCHGATLRAGSRGAATSPDWTRVDGTQRTCASCHAEPPASHALYATPTDCHRCHSGTVLADGTIDVAGRQHIDGATPVPTACNACHDAPPASGAHLAHANVADPSALAYGALFVDVGTSPAGAPAYVFGCGYCHPTDAALHRDGTAEVELAPPAGGTTVKSLNAAGAAFDAPSATCSGVYCHGATLKATTRGPQTAPVWTDATPRTCGSCHLAPPGSHASYPGATVCQSCHTQTVLASGAIDYPGKKHIDGIVEAPTGGGCTMCHGAPPATGAHRVHANPADPSAVTYGALTVLEDVQPAGGPSYDFGCGHCHPTDPARHAALAPLAQIELTPPATPVPGDEIKARNDPAAAYDATGKTCSGVYCHSSGQATPAFVASPAWNAAPGTLGCNGCHGNPPRYASGGAGTATANNHLVLGEDGFESGHFHGLPGPWHGSYHGGAFAAADPAAVGKDSAPITCETCHAETVDPAAHGPSGFYWLDTTGDYHFAADAPGADPARVSSPYWPLLQCTACHDGATAPVGAGKVLPLRHVNGKRDVVFDRRTALPALSWLPGTPNTPTRPYWGSTSSTDPFQLPTPPPQDAVMEGFTFSAHLASATYDPATKTCSTVACHLGQTQVQWGGPQTQWPNVCVLCHTNY